MSKIIFSLFFLIVCSLSAQQVTVLDSNSKVPLEGVLASFQGFQKFSDSNGQIQIEKINDNELISIGYYGYETQKITLEQLKEQSFLVYMEQIEGLNEVVISNTKWNQSQGVVPQQVIKTTAKEIVNTNPQTAADLLQKSGKVFVQKSQLGGGSPMIRGFSTNRLLISVDGVRMNNAIFRSGNLQNIISIDPFTVETSEVILGPGSVVYGSDAVGGTMNFLTITPAFSKTDSLNVNGKIVSRYSSANTEKTIHAHVSVGAKKIASLTSFSFSDFDDLVQGNNGPSVYLRNSFVQTINNIDVETSNANPNKQVSSGFKQYNFLQKINYLASDKVKIGLDFTYNTTSDYNRYDQLLRTNDDGGFRFAEWFYGPQKWLKLSNKIDITKKSTFYNSLRLTNTYQFFEESRNTRDFGSLEREVNTEKLGAYNFNVDAEKFHKNHSLYYGFEYVYNRVGSTASVFNIDTETSLNSSDTRYPNNANWQSIAGYLVSNTKLSNKVNLSAGIRYNHILLNADFIESELDFPFTEANVNTGALTGSLGLAYSISNNWQLKSNLGTAFRAPNIDDIGKITQDLQPGTLIVPNPDLKSEYAYNTDFSVSHTSKKSQFTFTGFYTYLDNAITTDSFTLNGEAFVDFNGEQSEVQASQNSEELFTYGLEFSGKLQLYRDIKFTGTYTLTKGQENQSDGDKVPVRHVAPSFGSFHLLYEKEKWHVDTYLDFNGSFSFSELAPSEKEKTHLYAIDNDGNPYQPSWYTLNIRGNYHLTKKLNIVAGIENITNQRYRTYSSGISSPGINVVTSLNYEF